MPEELRVLNPENGKPVVTVAVPEGTRVGRLRNIEEDAAKLAAVTLGMFNSEGLESQTLREVVAVRPARLGERLDRLGDQ